MHTATTESQESAIVDDADRVEPPSVPRDHPSQPAPLHLQHDVAAIVSTGGPRELAALLEQLESAHDIPAHLVIVSGEEADDFGPTLAASHLPRRLDLVRVLRLPGEPSPQHALAAGLDQLTGQEVRYAWLLTHSSRPAPGALTELLAVAQRSRTAAVVAPKVRTASSPPALLSVGYPLTEAGRWVQRPRVGEADQGQYDDRSDVLATSGVGALFEISALRAVGGYAPRLRRRSDAVAADVDLGWRLHRDGGRVLLVPQAVVEIASEEADAQAHAGELAASARRSLRAIALGATPLYRWVPRILAVLVTAFAGAVTMLLAKQPRAAGRELVDGLAVLRLGRAWSAHRRFAPRRAVPRKALTQLFVTREEARTAVFDEIIPQRRGRAAPTRQDYLLRGRRPQAVAHPAFLAVLTALAFTVVQGRDLGGSLVTRLGWGVTGGEVGGSTATASALWRTAADAWGDRGLGSEQAWSPALGLLAGATAVVERLPFLDPPPAPVSATVAAILLLSLPAAALTMYAALGLVTPLRSIRALGGLVWAASGLASEVIGQGRLGGAVVLVVLPLAAGALVRALGPRGRSYDAAQAGLALAVIGAFAPIVAVAAIVLTILLGLVPRWSLRRSLGTIAVPLLVLAPFIRGLVRGPQAALGGVGLFDWSGEVPPAWRLALLDPGATVPEGLPVVLVQSLPFLAVPLLALALLGAARASHRMATCAAVLAGVLSLAAAAATSRLVVDTVPLGTTGAGQPVRPWAGSILLLYALVVTALAIRGLDLLARMGLRRRIAKPLVALAGLMAVGALVIGTGWTGFGAALSTFTDPRPAVAVDHADGPLAGRSLLIGRLTAAEGADTATAYRLVSADAGMPVRALPEPVEVSAPLDAFVSRLDVGALDAPGTDLPGGAAAVLARHAVGFVALADELPAEAVRGLDATDGLQRLPDRDGLRWWRVESTTSDVPSPARLVLRSADGDGVVVPRRNHAQASVEVAGAGTLEVAQTAAWARSAVVRLDGLPLAAVTDDATVTYAVPGSGHLEVARATPERGLRTLAAVSLLVIAYLALPFGGARPASREGDR